MDALTAAEAILANVQNELDHLRHRIEQLGQNPRPWSNRAWRRRAEIMEELIAVGEAKLRALEVLEEVKEVRSFLPARPPMSFFADDRTSESLSTSRSTTMKAQTTTQMHARTRTSKAAPRLPRPHPPPRPAPPPPPPNEISCRHCTTCTLDRLEIVLPKSMLDALRTTSPSKPTAIAGTSGTAGERAVDAMIGGFVFGVLLTILLITVGFPSGGVGAVVSRDTTID